MKRAVLFIYFVLALSIGAVGFVGDAFATEVNSADTAFTLSASALVLLMTLPGLAMFYAGLVRAKNVLSVMMHCVSIAGLASVLWFIVGYSVAFDHGNALIGSLSKSFLHGVHRDSVTGSLPEIVFFLFQMTFAVITPSLIVGAVPERVSFPFLMIFSGLWILVVYAPVTHWVWGNGWLMALHVMDFAGGLVVHATAGTSALVLAILVGKRPGFPRELQPPHNPGMTMIGAGMLWVGWFGFNGGSALSASADAGMAIVVTHLSASAACLTWMIIEWVRFKRPSMIGTVTGAVAGLATVTPASGFVGPVAGLVLGVAGSCVCFIAVDLVKHRYKIDDSLDVFAVHGVGGIIGTLLVAIFAAPYFGGVGYAEGNSMATQLLIQFAGVMATMTWSGLVTYLIILVLKAIMPIRPNGDDIEEGLDLSAHGERGYTLQ